MKVLFAATLLLFTTLVKAQSTDQSQLPASFQKKLDDGKLIFTKPEGTIEVLVIPNTGVKYDYALKVKDKNVEVRYIIMPLTKDFFDAYEKRDKTPGDTVFNPNRMYVRLPAIMYNKIAEGKLKLEEIKLQPMHAKDQGADGGSMFAGPIGTTFGQKYTFSFFAVIHKDYAADVYALYLFEDQATMFDQMKDIMKNTDFTRSVRFKP
ncbi:hypothetical protein FO440_13955 [Mucilaginibacter corticis]|uniref:Uncharacterized protein n=1 Tax=Mucilaginibacter corticis TaxID=2597670 RepID=A0A556MM15_9SPHI|nr:hypothetical protein [Mucilaginibacter corticis]TSJ40839.1 hypothetical protein FO440_13955 [Mucilaginibacter corticis]